MKKEYAINIRFRGEGETNKEAEARIKKVKKIADNNNRSFADVVRIAVDNLDDDKVSWNWK